MDHRPSTVDESGAIVSRTAPEKCPVCGSADLVQDEDVLDTWFSSWLWPFSTLGWPDDTADLRYFYPTSTLVTGPDIIFFWVARMMMAGIEFAGGVPFTRVFFTGIIRDMQGRKMSKSLGNSPDPLDVIATYGADALRFTIARLSPLGQDVHYAAESCELGRNFANKIWNASRFVLMNLGEGIGEGEGDGALTLDDRFILSRLNRAARDVTAALDAFRFNEAAERLYDFFWSDYCDWYIESVKGHLQAGGGADARRSRRVLLRCLETFLRLLCPFMPFLSEEIWQMLPGREGESVTRCPWPAADPALVDPALERRVELRFEAVRAVRNLRKEHRVPPRAEVGVVFRPASDDEAAAMEEGRAVCTALMKARELRVDPRFAPERPMPTAPLSSGSIVYVDLSGSVDPAVERARVSRELGEIDAELAKVDRELVNEAFVAKAPPKVVEMRRRKREALLARRDKVIKGLKAL